VTPRLRALVAAAFFCGALLGGLAAFGASEPDFAALKAKFRRPAAIPFPASNPYSVEKRVLGEKLFHDKRLSADGSIACASCHDRRKGFSDGRVTAIGVPRRPLRRHTPTLWNLAWTGPSFWDGRARSLEEQVAGPIIAPDEMAQPIDKLVARLAADRDYARAFAKAFPRDPRVSEENLKKAVATYERTLVSPPTRFDRWVEGESVLSAQEIEGFRLFAGKAGCATVTPVGRSRTTRSTTSGCRARIAAVARCCGWSRPSMPSRRRPCARSAAARPTCMTARSPR
jgi:cytochrome c peroxidase